jgi:hypothetical protein
MRYAPSDYAAKNSPSLNIPHDCIPDYHGATKKLTLGLPKMKNTPPTRLCETCFFLGLQLSCAPNRSQVPLVERAFWNKRLVNLRTYNKLLSDFPFVRSRFFASAFKRCQLGGEHFHFLGVILRSFVMARLGYMKPCMADGR